MIRKILKRDYLKGYGDMTAEERRAFVGRVGEWLAQDGERLLAMTDRPMAKSQNLVTITARWTAEDTKAVTDGIMLMSAMVAVADTWLPTQIYMKSAYRAIRQVVSVLSEVPGFKFQVSGEVSTAPELPAVGAKEVSGFKFQVSGVVSTPELPAVRAKVLSPQPSSISHQPSSAVVPARPKHIDQYVHLLPKATQERAAEYGELMRQLGEARDNMQLLMDDEHASAKSREQWAKQATRIDKQVRAIREELDREWEKVAESGRVVIDDLGMAHLVNEELRMKNEEFATAGENSAISPQPSSLSLQPSQASRRNGAGNCGSGSSTCDAARRGKTGRSASSSGG